MTKVSQAAIDAARERAAVISDKLNYPISARFYRSGSHDCAPTIQSVAHVLQEISDAIEAGDTSAFVLAKDVDPVVLAARELVSARYDPSCVDFIEATLAGEDDNEKAMLTAITAIRRGIEMAKEGKV